MKTETQITGDSTTERAETQANHTPLPWRSHDTTAIQRRKVRVFEIKSATGESIASICQDLNNPHTEANAEFIVRACNSHGALLAAMNSLVDLCGGLMSRTDSGCDYTEDDGAIYAAARAAIALATGGKAGK